MSTIQVSDRRGGVYEVVVTFSYGECARLPFNSLRKVNARIDQIRNGGLKATAQFNLRNSKESANFIEVLDLFGEDGSFVHGSPADPEDLKQDQADDDEESELTRTTVVNAQMTSSAAPSSAATSAAHSGLTKSTREKNSTTTEQEEADDLEIDEGFGLVAEENWMELAENEVIASLGEHENKEETLSRIKKVSGDRYTEQMAREKMIALLWEKFQDEAYVAAFLKRRDWNDVTEEEVRNIANI